MQKKSTRDNNAHNTFHTRRSLLMDFNNLIRGINSNRLFAQKKNIINSQIRYARFYGTFH